MNMSEMRGELADAIRDSHVPNVKSILAKEAGEDYKPFMLVRKIKQLKKAERLARTMQKRNAEIQDILKLARESLESVRATTSIPNAVE